MKKLEFTVEIEFRNQKLRFLTFADNTTEALEKARKTFQGCVILGWVSKPNEA